MQKPGLKWSYNSVIKLQNEPFRPLDFEIPIFKILIKPPFRQNDDNCKAMEVYHRGFRPLSPDSLWYGPRPGAPLREVYICSHQRVSLEGALSGALMPPATYHPNQITVQTRHIEIEPSAVYASIYLNSVYPAGAHNMSCLNPKAVSIWCNIRLVSAISSYLNHKNPIMTLPDNRAAARYGK